MTSTTHRNDIKLMFRKIAPMMVALGLLTALACSRGEVREPVSLDGVMYSIFSLRFFGVGFSVAGIMLRFGLSPLGTLAVSTLGFFVSIGLPVLVLAFLPLGGFAVFALTALIFLIGLTGTVAVFAPVGLSVRSALVVVEIVDWLGFTALGANLQALFKQSQLQCFT